MRRLLATAAAAAVLATAPAIASADDTKWVAVDSVGAARVYASFTNYWVLAVTGIREGEDAPSTEVVVSYIGNSSTVGYFGLLAEKAHDRCHQMALLALTKPGRFQLVVSSEPGNPIIRLTGCTLTRID